MIDADEEVEDVDEGRLARGGASPISLHVALSSPSHAFIHPRTTIEPRSDLPIEDLGDDLKRARRSERALRRFVDREREDVDERGDLEEQVANFVKRERC